MLYPRLWRFSRRCASSCLASRRSSQLCGVGGPAGGQPAPHLLLLLARQQQKQQQCRGFISQSRQLLYGAGSGYSPFSGTRVSQMEGQEDHDDHDRPVTPWVRTVASGVELLRNPKYNKGMGFTPEEREKLHLQGLLPPAFMPQALQVERVLSNLHECNSDLQKYVHMISLQDRNEKLFYEVLLENIEHLMPIIYTPTVGLACQRYGLLFRRPRGLFITINDRGRVFEILKNWPEKRVRVIVITDGERILGLGDLGVQGMGIAVGKLTLYTVCGGVNPSECLPVTIDVGTNNQTLLEDPFYPGLRQERVRGEAYDELIDEFMVCAKKRFGDNVLVQFEDFANHNAFRLLFQYRGSHLVFNDDIQGTASVALAGLMAARPMTGKALHEQRYLFFGAGEAGTGIAELIATAISKERNIPVQEARKLIFLVDSKGLVTFSRLETLHDHKLPFAHKVDHCPDLLSAIRALKPNVLIGVSAQSGAFNREVLTAMASINTRPIIFALSNPTSKSECTAAEALTITQGRGIFASGSPFPPVEVQGELVYPAQGNNAYIFPGIGLGCIISTTRRLRDEMFIAAAEALAEQVTDADRKVGRIYPPFSKIRTISAHIAKAVAVKSYELGLAAKWPRPDNLLALAKSSMYNPRYRPIR